MPVFVNPNTSILQNTSNPSVDYIRLDLREFEKRYSIIRDCLDGDPAIKGERLKYLPKPNPEDTSYENSLRYESYLQRAVFYNVTNRTLRGLVGQIFLRDPIHDLPEIMQPIVVDANGEGVDLIQLSKKLCGYVIAFGRAGILVDYPTTMGQTTIEQLRTGQIRPVIKVYAPWDVINWKTITIGSLVTLSLVVIRESVCVDDGTFGECHVDRYRVLRLTENRCITEIWEQMENGNFEITQTYELCDHTGEVMDTIPFKFVGSENNDNHIDFPPMFDLATLNIAHYRNSADYEEACFISGQPTLYLTGLTEEWWTDILKKKIFLGSRAAIPLPAESDAGLLQALPTTMPFEAMTHKEKQMVALGAKLVEPRNIERTATETEIESASDHSVLMTSALNASSALLWSLNAAAAFIGVTEELKFELNINFDLTSMTSEELRIVILAWQSQAISFSEMRENLKRSGTAKLTDDEAIAELRALKNTFAFEKGDTFFERDPPSVVLANKPEPQPNQGNSNAN